MEKEELQQAVEKVRKGTEKEELKEDIIKSAGGIVDGINKLIEMGWIIKGATISFNETGWIIEGATISFKNKNI